MSNSHSTHISLNISHPNFTSHFTSHVHHTYSTHSQRCCPSSECYTDRSWKAPRWLCQKLRKIYVTCDDDSFGGMQDLAVVRPLVRSKATICHQVTRVTWVKQVESSWIPLANAHRWEARQCYGISIWMESDMFPVALVCFLASIWDILLSMWTHMTSWRLTSLLVVIPLSTKIREYHNPIVNANPKFPGLKRILRPPPEAVMCRLRQV